jgi:hypothetical protein
MAHNASVLNPRVHRDLEVDSLVLSHVSQIVFTLPLKALAKHCPEGPNDDGKDNNYGYDRDGEI